MIETSRRHLQALKHRNGLYSASALTVSTGYDKAWIRDNVYIALGIEAVDPEERGHFPAHFISKEGRYKGKAFPLLFYHD